MNRSEPVLQIQSAVDITLCHVHSVLSCTQLLEHNSGFTEGRWLSLTNVCVRMWLKEKKRQVIGDIDKCENKAQETESRESFSYCLSSDALCIICTILYNSLSYTYKLKHLHGLKILP